MPQGDRHLVAATTALRSGVREVDHLARIGGDEFAVLATRITPEEADQLVERLRDAMSAAGVDASLGAASYRIAAGLDAALEEADAAMYRDNAQRRSS